MTTEDDLIKYENAIRDAQLRTDTVKLSQTQQAIMLQEQEKGIASEQLDTSEDLKKIYNLLNGYIYKKDDDGVMNWFPPKDNDMVILTDYGIQFVMGKLITYLSKNTLLSNYDDEQINAKMEDIANNINDTIFMEYDKMFLYPTLKDCKDEIKKRIKVITEKRKFAKELLGMEIDEEEIEKQVLKEMESRIERELTIIKEQKMKTKLKRFESIVRDIQDTIHSAYQRAWKGLERSSIRTHMHISETKGGGFITPEQKTSYNPLAILRRKQ